MSHTTERPRRTLKGLSQATSPPEIDRSTHPEPSRLGTLIGCRCMSPSLRRLHPVKCSAAAEEGTTCIPQAGGGVRCSLPWQQAHEQLRQARESGNQTLYRQLLHRAHPGARVPAALAGPSTAASTRR